MKAVMISIQPKWVEKIASGKKTIEVRKSRPKIETPFKCYIYATKSGDRIVLKNDRVWEISKELTGKVIGEFVCDRIYPIQYEEHTHGDYYYNIFDTFNPYTQKVEGLPPKHCLTFKELDDYLLRGNGYGWHISDLKIYDKPKELSEFKRWNRTEENSSCTNMKWLYPDCKDCKECNLIRPPQSWCYIEEKQNER